MFSYIFGRYHTISFPLPAPSYRNVSSVRFSMLSSSLGVLKASLHILFNNIQKGQLRDFSNSSVGFKSL